MSHLEDIVYGLFTVAFGLLAAFFIVVILSMFVSMGCWAYNDAALHHDAKLLMQHCG